MNTEPTRALVRNIVFLALSGLLAGTAVASETAERELEEHRAALEQARSELIATQAELSRVAARVAEASARLHREEFDRAYRRSSLLQPVLGLVLQADPRNGVRISAVSPGSAAADAGLRPGERILGIDSQAIAGANAGQRLDRARSLLGALSLERDVLIELDRDRSPREIKLRPRALPGLIDLPLGPEIEAALAERLPTLIAPRWAYSIGPTGPVVLCADGKDDCIGAIYTSGLWQGIRLVALNPDLGRYFGSERGVLVLSNDTEVEGLQAGDVLLEINSVPVDDPGQAMRALRRGEREGSSAVVLLRDRKSHNISLATPKLGVLPLLLPGPAPALKPARPNERASLPPARPELSLHRQPPTPAKAALPSSSRGVLRGVLIDQAP